MKKVKKKHSVNKGPIQHNSSKIVLIWKLFRIVNGCSFFDFIVEFLRLVTTQYSCSQEQNVTSLVRKWNQNQLRFTPASLFHKNCLEKRPSEMRCFQAFTWNWLHQNLPKALYTHRGAFHSLSNHRRFFPEEKDFRRFLRDFH